MGCRGQGQGGGGQEGPMLTSDSSRRAAEDSADPHGLKLSCLERESQSGEDQIS